MCHDCDPVGGLRLEDIRSDRERIPRDVEAHAGDGMTFDAVDRSTGKITRPPQGACGEGTAGTRTLVWGLEDPEAIREAMRQEAELSRRVKE